MYPQSEANPAMGGEEGEIVGQPPTKTTLYKEMVCHIAIADQPPTL